MFKIGIIVNPFSGKDLRRITSQASNVGNNEKAMKVVRMVNCMKRFGVEKVYLMPDNYLLNANIAAIIQKDDNTGLIVELLDFIPTDRPDDTIKAVEMMKNLDIACLIVLGGDGTSRLVAKTDIAVPVIAVSTGTNNVYPEFWEGTTVGIAASYIGKRGLDKDMHRGKRIEIYLNGEFCDIALVDAVVTDVPYIGSRVVTDVNTMKEIIVSRCSPSSVGFSAIIGNIAICEEKDNFGYRLRLAKSGSTIVTPVSPGKLSEISYSEFARLDIGYGYICVPEYDGTIALDGERTVSFRTGDQIKFVITKNGLYKVDVRRTLYEAVESKFFQIKD